MKNIDATSLMKEIRKMRKAILDNLVNLMDKHNTTIIDCVEQDSCPIIFSGTDDDCMTLDRVKLDGFEGDKFIVFDCSGSYDDASLTIGEIDIELLIEVYEWIIDNEEFLFENE